MLLVGQLLCFGLFASAQDTTDLWVKARQNPNLGRHRYLEVKLHGGSHIYSGDGLDELLKHGYRSLELRTGWQSSGRQVWQRVFNWPSYGLGFYTGNIGDVAILGNPSGLYGFIYIPFHERKRNHFEAGLSLGFTYDLKPYNAKTNPLNDAISSKVDVYFNANVGGVLRLSEMFDFVYGLDITHFSNGRTHTPNLGLNMVGLNGGFRFHYNAIGRIVREQIDSTYIAPRRPVKLELPIPPVNHYHQLALYAAFGVVQNDSRIGSDAFYGTASAVLDYSYRYSHAGSAGAGIDGLYDASLGRVYKTKYGRNPVTDRMLAGVHLGHSLHLQRFEIITQAGTYWWRRDDEKGSYFLRVALRYNISNYGFVQIGLKTLSGGAADWIEWGGGGKWLW